MATTRVVVIDDEEGIRLSLEELISLEYKAEVFTFDSVDEFLKFLDHDSEKIHLIISDIHMPTGSGLRVGTELEKRNLNIPLIYFTGVADKVPKNPKYKIVRKPFIGEELVQLIREYLE